MDKETVFKEIRRQQVLLWAGAGFSRYADYPMGKGVVERLYEELSNAQRQRLAESLQQKETVCPDMSLPEFAQRFVALHYGNREKLVEVLTDIFSAKPTSTRVHEALEKIAYIDNIVTTNYDSLFELTYGTANLHVVTEADNVPQIGRKNTTLFKIHGELNRPKTLIITKDDYQRFFEKADDLVWTHLRALMSSKTIVFIGYAVEDPNVLDVFLGLVDRLGNLMKPAYIIGPSMDELTSNDLRRKNIHYIKATGEEFVNELLEDTKDKMLSESQGKNPISPSSTSRTLTNLGIRFNMNVSGNDFIFSNLKSSTGKTKRQISLTAKEDDIQQAIEAIKKGESIKPIDINISQLSHFSHKVEGITIPNNGILSLWLSRAPGWSGIADVRLSSGLLIPNVFIGIYGNKSELHIVALSKTTRIEYLFSPSDKNNNLKAEIGMRYNAYPNTADLLEHANIALALDKSENFDILQKGKKIWSTNDFVKFGTNFKPTFKAKQATRGKSLLDLVEMLPVIEKAFSISFQNFSLENQSIGDILDLYYILLQTPYRDSTIKQISYKPEGNSNATLDQITTGKPTALKHKLELESSNTQEFEILGWQLQATWTETEIIEKPVAQRIKNEFKITSKQNIFIRNSISIDSAVVLKSPDWTTIPTMSEEEKTRERMPKFTFE